MVVGEAGRRVDVAGLGVWGRVRRSVVGGVGRLRRGWAVAVVEVARTLAAVAVVAEEAVVAHTLPAVAEHKQA